MKIITKSDFTLESLYPLIGFLVAFLSGFTTPMWCFIGTIGFSCGLVIASANLWDRAEWEHEDFVRGMKQSGALRSIVSYHIRLLFWITFGVLIICSGLGYFLMFAVQTAMTLNCVRLAWLYFRFKSVVSSGENW